MTVRNLTSKIEHLFIIMIRKLSIRNYAIIEALDIRFSERLSTITGETGAGKSILLGALGLILGKRADSKALFDQSQKCVVEAAFDVRPYGLEAFFEANDLDYEPETVLRREITAAGKSRAFINDTPVNLNQLGELSARLIDLHQQFDTLNIQDADFQLRLLDALAKTKAQAAEYARLYRNFDEGRRQLTRLQEQNRQAGKETDFVLFQLEELDKAKLRPGEQEEMEQEQKQLSHAEEIKRTLSRVAGHLHESENSLTSQLQSMSQKIGHIAEFHGQLPPLLERFEGLIYELEDLSAEFASIADDTEYDGERLQEIAERLDVLYRLQNKHKVSSADELIALQSELQSQLRGNEDLEQEIAELEQRLSEQEKQLRTIGKELSAKRRSVVDAFQKEVHALLRQLSMPHARLSVEIEESDRLLPSGMNTVRFLFAANKGSRPEEIKNVASGGELSRLALCVKSLIANALPLPTLIFDEIDSGVSGEVAMQMGNILAQLASDHQVISITHSPQIASKAEAHYFVHKRVQGERTLTQVRLLDPEERVLEIAKMLSGNPPSEAAKHNARELLMVNG